jgi:hypothetical protein
MRTTFILLSLCALSAGVCAQRTVNDILAAKQVEQSIYQVHRSVLKTMIIDHSYYRQRKGLSAYERETLARAKVVGVDLVFSDYPLNESKDALNRHHILQLYGVRKDLVTDSNVEWNIIRQTGCRNEAQALRMFHGIVIHYRPAQSERIRAEDCAAIGSLPPTGDSLQKLVTKDRQFGVILPDTSLVKMLDRNTQWKDMLVVADMTGSMSPYAMQLAVWFQLRMKGRNVAGAVFFNDGDATPEDEKVIGDIGGIYMTKKSGYEELLQQMGRTVAGGCGGDAPENNCEALIAGIAAFPQAKDIVLIADNFAPVKDISLVEKIGRPVHVIVCGAEFMPVHSDYLEIAYRTNGTLHTISQDIRNLSDYNEGETIRIGEQNYLISKGKFILLKTT